MFYKHYWNKYSQTLYAGVRLLQSISCYYLFIVHSFHLVSKCLFHSQIIVDHELLSASNWQSGQALSKLLSLCKLTMSSFGATGMTSYVSIYHTSEQYFSRVLIGQLGGDQPSSIHLRAAEEKQNGFCRYIVTCKITLFWLLGIQLVWYILKQLFTSVSVKVVNFYLPTSRLGRYPPLFTFTSVNNC